MEGEQWEGSRLWCPLIVLQSIRVTMKLANTFASDYKRRYWLLWLSLTFRFYSTRIISTCQAKMQKILKYFQINIHFLLSNQIKQLSLKLCLGLDTIKKIPQFTVEFYKLWNLMLHFFNQFNSSWLTSFLQISNQLYNSIHTKTHQNYMSEHHWNCK